MADECCSMFKKEFQIKRFGFSDVNFARFIYSQWRWPIGLVVLYRFLLSAYTIAWSIYIAFNQDWKLDTSTDIIPAWAFLTIWTYFVLTLYLFVHFMISLCFTTRRGRFICSKPVRTHHQRLFHELEDSRLNQYEIVHGTESDTETEPRDHPDIPRDTANTSRDRANNNNTSRDRANISELSAPYKAVWVLYNVASSGCFMVTILYWTMLYTQSGETNYTDVQIHGITSVIIVIEHLVSAVPVRLYHVWFPLLYGLIYLIFSVLFYKLHPLHPVIYPGVLDFDHPGKTTIVIVLTGVVLLPLVQLIFYSIYRLKLWLYAPSR